LAKQCGFHLRQVRAAIGEIVPMSNQGDKGAIWPFAAISSDRLNGGDIGMTMLAALHTSS